MEKRLMPHLLCMLVIMLSGCDDEDSSSILGGYKRQRVNFYGTLTTHQGLTYEVENISIDGHIKEIPVYEPVVASAKNMAATDFQLNINPKDDAITKIDLVGVAEIRVPNPERIWKYQKPGTTTQATEFIEIEVISNNDIRSMNKYLIEASKQINVYQKDIARSLAKNVPFRALKVLVIKGHFDRNAQEAEEKKNCSLLRQSSQGRKYAPSNGQPMSQSVARQETNDSVRSITPPECPVCPAPVVCPPCARADTSPAPAASPSTKNLGKSTQDLIDGRAPAQESNDQISRFNRDNSSF
jgi:hypothetical protein